MPRNMAVAGQKQPFSSGAYQREADCRDCINLNTLPAQPDTPSRKGLNTLLGNCLQPAYLKSKTLFTRLYKRKKNTSTRLVLVVGGLHSKPPHTNVFRYFFMYNSSCRKKITATIITTLAILYKGESRNRIWAYI